MSTKAYDTVKLARANKRPTGLDYIHNLCGTSLSSTGTGATPTTAPSSGASAISGAFL